MTEQEVRLREGRRPIGKMVHELDNLIFRNILAHGRQYGYDQMTVMNGWILGYLLGNSDKDIFQKDIENEFGITKSTVTGIIKLMEQKGFLERVSVPHDARLKKLVLTDMGRQYEDKMGRQFVNDEKRYLKNITEEEYAVFVRVIDKIKENIKE